MKNLDATVPSVRETTDPRPLAGWLEEEGQLALLHDANVPESPEVAVETHFVSCVALFDETPETVREAVLDFDTYPEMLDQVTGARRTASSDGRINGEFELQIETPVISPSFEYELSYRETPDGDLLFESVGGDFNHVLGRWEFLEVDGKTLVAYTIWYDLSDLGWTLSTIFWAQPDYREALPVTQVAVQLEQMRHGILGDQRKESPPVEELPADPEVPLFQGTEFPRDSFRDLAGTGTLMYVHPTRWIREDDHALDFRFVTGIGLMEKPPDRVKSLTTQFGRFPEFIDQVSRVDAREVEGGYEATWHLDVGVSLLPLSLQYSLDYEWEGSNSLPFRQTDGDLRYVYGALEWEPVAEDRTLFFYTTATQVGRKDSTLVQFAKLLPHLQIIIGVSTGALAVKKQVEWVNAQ